MYINTQKDLKSLASGLRRELKACYPDFSLSHNQTLELIAAGLGMPLAQLQKSLPAVSEKAAPKNSWAVANTKGELDLLGALVPGEEPAPAQVLDGRTFAQVEGTLEDIFECTAYATTATRKPGGQLDVHYEGSTEVNWDAQRSRKDRFGQLVWVREGQTIPGHLCLLAPEGFRGPDEPGWEDLPVREDLVDRYEALAKHLGLTEALRQELHAGQSTEVYEQLLEHIEFGLHRGERNRLYSLLVHKDI